MNNLNHTYTGTSKVARCHRLLTNRFLWPYSQDQSSLHRWRAFTLSSMLLAGLVFGIFALIPGIVLAIRENVWHLAVADLAGLFVTLILIFVHHIPFKVRAATALILVYGIGISVIISVGPLSGGPIWLFAFAVLASVLLGNLAAMGAIVMNALALTSIALMISHGIIGDDFPWFNTPHAMVAAVVNFIVVNAITAVAVSALLKGLYTSEKKYRLIADNVADVIWTTDMNLRFTYVSPSVFQMQGFSAEEIMEKTLKQLVSPQSLEQLLDLYSKKMDQWGSKDPEALAPFVFEAEQCRSDGTFFWVSVNARLIRGRDNTLQGVLGVTRDITRQKHSEAEKIRAEIAVEKHEKLALVGRVAGKMAHDFNNILGIIMGHSELALSVCTDKDTRNTLDVILTQTRRGRNLTQNLTAFARSHEPRWEWVVFNEKVESVLDLLKIDLDGIPVKKQWGERIEIMADANMIEHTLVNLIQNAVDAVSLTKNPEIRLRIGLTDCDHLEFEIRDNGCGIPSEYTAEAIYEPSFTLKGSQDVAGHYQSGIKGTGYGMANVKKTIERHGGNITVESEPNVFTRVIIHLPRMEKQLTIEEKKRLATAAPQSGLSILLVEDEPTISEVQYKILTQPPLNHRVDIATTGEEALDLFQAKTYDLVSLDYILAGRHNGKHVYSSIRQLKKHLPILFVSGNIEFLESIKTLKQADPLIEHLSKPCKNIDYVNSINALIQMQTSLAPACTSGLKNHPAP